MDMPVRLPEKILSLREGVERPKKFSKNEKSYEEKEESLEDGSRRGKEEPSGSCPFTFYSFPEMVVHIGEIL